MDEENRLRNNFEERFFFGLCPISLQRGEPKTALKACSGCYSVSYLGKEQQKAHWKRHKHVCKVLQKLVEKNSHHHPLSGNPNKSGKVQIFLQSSLRRELTQFESDMLIYPRLCMVCLDGNQSKLINCPKCHCAAYCGPSHLQEDAENHALSCSSLEICLRDYVREARNPVEFARFQNDFKPVVVSAEYRPLPKSIEEVFSCDDETHLRAFTFNYTCQLTVLFGLEKFYSAPQLGEKESLTLHVVGARKAEAKYLQRWEIFPSLLPKLKRLNVVFVGPELERRENPTSKEEEEDCVEYISERLKAARPEVRMRYQFVRSNYDEKIVKKLKRPDCVVALNCGFVFYKSWDEAIPVMIGKNKKKNKCPLIFTEYYAQDNRLNLEKIDSLVDEELEVIIDPESENPFRSLLPARIPTGFAFRKFNRRNVVMSNDFVCVIVPASGARASS